MPTKKINKTDAFMSRLVSLLTFQNKLNYSSKCKTVFLNMCTWLPLIRGLLLEFLMDYLHFKTATNCTIMIMTFL